MRSCAFGGPSSTFWLSLHASLSRLLQHDVFGLWRGVMVCISGIRTLYVLSVGRQRATQGATRTSHKFTFTYMGCRTAALHAASYTNVGVGHGRTVELNLEHSVGY